MNSELVFHSVVFSQLVHVLEVKSRLETCHNLFGAEMFASLSEQLQHWSHLSGGEQCEHTDQNQRSTGQKDCISRQQNSHIHSAVGDNKMPSETFFPWSKIKMIKINWITRINKMPSETFFPWSKIKMIKINWITWILELHEHYHF